jgi:hypothetical protein
MGDRLATTASTSTSSGRSLFRSIESPPWKGEEKGVTSICSSEFSSVFPGLVKSLVNQESVESPPWKEEEMGVTLYFRLQQ